MDPSTLLRQRARRLKLLAGLSFTAAILTIIITPFLGPRFLQIGAILAALVSALGFVVWTKSRELQRQAGLADLLIPAQGTDD